MKNTKWYVLFLAAITGSLTHAESTGAAGGAAGAVAGPLIQGLLGPIAAAFGGANVSMDIYTYTYKTSTLYRGTASSVTWTVQPGPGGGTSYKKVMTISGVDNPMTITDTTTFSIAMGGADGDIPLAIRRHKCDMAMSLTPGDLFKSTTSADITFKVLHKYTTNPYFMDPQTTVRITCSGWDNQRASCDNVVGQSSESFLCTISNNGSSYASIPGGRTVNIQHGANSGIGVTW